MQTVFLSASFPEAARASESGPSYPADIATAAAATIEATLRSKARLLFGGHPTITPIVLSIAHLLAAGPQVVVYQSEYFRPQLTREVQRLVKVEGANMIFSPAGENRASSLRNLRNEMLAEDIDVAFFVGGMSGIEEEFTAIRQKRPKVKCLFFEAPGGYAARLASVHDAGQNIMNTLPNVRVLRGRAYGSLALRALEDLSVGNPASSDEL